MIVISDSSPVNILLRLGLIDILKALFGSIILPESVVQEMSKPQTPQVVRNWIADLPAWVTVKAPLHPPRTTSARHRGELDAIELATELKANAILLDDELGRGLAFRLGLRVIGTIGVLEIAANEGLIPDLKKVYESLRQTDFFINERILAESLARHLSHKHQ